MARLGDVLKVSSARSVPAASKNWLLNLDMVQQQTGKVIDYQYVSPDELEGSIVSFDTSVVLYSKLRPNLNKVVVPEKDGYCTSEMLPLQPDASRLSREYLAWYLRSDSFVTWAVSKTSGAKMPRLGTKELLFHSIPLPDLPTQRRIAATLDKVSEGIALCKQMLVDLDELVKSQFVEMFGDMYLNTMEWRELHLETMADIVSGITKGRKIAGKQLTKVPYMAVSNVKDGYIDWTTVKTIEATDQEINQYRLLPDDVLMTEGGDPDKLGRGAIIRTSLENCIHQNHIFRVRLDESHILPDYFAEYLKHQRAKRYFLGCAKQTTGIASINMKQLKALPVLLPPLELQNEFSAFIRQIDKSKFVVQQQMAELETLKKSLMQKYFG